MASYNAEPNIPAFLILLILPPHSHSFYQFSIYKHQLVSQSVSQTVSQTVDQSLPSSFLRALTNLIDFSFVTPSIT